MSNVAQQVRHGLPFPFGTLTVNLVGCALVGLFAEIADHQGLVSEDIRTFLIIGLLGGFTTFSAFGLETMTLLRNSEPWLACGNIVSHTVLGLMAVWLGYSSATWFWKYSPSQPVLLYLKDLELATSDTSADRLADHPLDTIPELVLSKQGPSHTKKGPFMRLNVFCLATLLWLEPTAASAGAPEPKTDEQKIFYSMGLTISRSIESFGLNESDLELVKSGISDGVLKTPPKVDLQIYGPKIHELQQTRASTVAEGEKKLGAAFLTKASLEPGSKKTESGALLTTIKEGKGAFPKRVDTVKVHYHGTLIDGTVFDSTLKQKAPATLIVSEMSKCWTEGILQMKAGGKSRLICPSNLAYRDKGLAPLIKPGATLVFDIDLVEVVAGQSMPSSVH